MTESALNAVVLGGVLQVRRWVRRASVVTGPSSSKDVPHHLEDYHARTPSMEATSRSPPLLQNQLILSCSGRHDSAKSFCH